MEKRLFTHPLSTRSRGESIVLVTVLVTCTCFLSTNVAAQTTRPRSEPCPVPPEAFSSQFFDKLDKADSGEVRALYEAHISSQARKTVTQWDFGEAVAKLKQPSFESATTKSKYEFLGVDRSRDAYKVYFSDFSKGYGPITRELEITCEGRDWKVNDFRVKPGGK